MLPKCALYFFYMLLNGFTMGFQLMKYIKIDEMHNAQIKKAKADAEISQFKAEALKNGTTQTTEDKLDELLEKISGELND